MTKKKIDDGHTVKSMTRTGSHDFVVEHESGDAFTCKIDDPRKFNAFKGLKNNGSRIGGFSGVGEKKALICNKCNKQVSRATYQDGKWLCSSCK